MHRFAYGAISEKRLFVKSSPVSAAAGAAKMIVSAARTVLALMLVVVSNVGLLKGKTGHMLSTYPGQILSRI
jgi:hypothetical protein